MLLDVLDQSALASSVRDELGKCYPDAKVAHVKDGGNFPYLSRDQEVNMYANQPINAQTTHTTHTHKHTPLSRRRYHHRRRRRRPHHHHRCPTVLAPAAPPPKNHQRACLRFFALAWGLPVLCCSLLRWLPHPNCDRYLCHIPSPRWCML